MKEVLPHSLTSSPKERGNRVSLAISFGIFVFNIYLLVRMQEKLQGENFCTCYFTFTLPGFLLRARGRSVQILQEDKDRAQQDFPSAQTGMQVLAGFRCRLICGCIIL